MNTTNRIYLDNAATSWPKPEGVYRAVDQYMRDVGAAAGRGAYRHADQTQRMVAQTRRHVAQLFGAEEPNRIIFTGNCTDSLNLALHGMLRPGDHVVTSVLEHNSVLRPLRFLQQHRQVQVTRVGCNADGLVEAGEIESAITERTRLIALVHTSNVTGAIQPIEAVGQLARQRDIPLLVDAAQSAGHLEIDVNRLGVSMLAAPAHKGLLGPLGLGLLYIAPGVERQLTPIRQGGTGSDSQQDIQPDSLPERYESGNLNVPGIVGLGAGLDYLSQRTLVAVSNHELQLTAKLLAGFEGIQGVTLYGPKDAAKQVGVVSVNIAGFEPQEVAATLDAAYGIQVRSGLHCAPLTHQALGTLASGGTVRFSLGPLTTEAEIGTVIQAVQEIAAAAVGV